MDIAPKKQKTITILNRYRRPRHRPLQTFLIGLSIMVVIMLCLTSSIPALQDSGEVADLRVSPEQMAQSLKKILDKQQVELTNMEAQLHAFHDKDMPARCDTDQNPHQGGPF